MDSLGATRLVLPELSELRGLEQSRFHHLDVYEHTRSVLAEAIELARDPEPAFGRHADAVRAVLSEPLANQLTAARRCGSGRCFTTSPSRTPEALPPRDGSPSSATTRRERASPATSSIGCALASAYASTLQRSPAITCASAFWFTRCPSAGGRFIGLRACAPVEVDVTVLSVADRLATRGAGAEDAIAKHVRLAGELTDDA